MYNKPQILKTNENAEKKDVAWRNQVPRSFGANELPEKCVRVVIRCRCEYFFKLRWKHEAVSMALFSKMNNGIL